MRVKVANGQYVWCHEHSKQFKWKIHELEFTFDMKLVKVGGCDMVLGMDWIDTMAPIVLHTKPLSISFIRDSKVVHLLGYTVIQPPIEVDARKIKRLLYTGQCNYVAQLLLAEKFKTGDEIPEEVPNL